MRGKNARKNARMKNASETMHSVIRPLCVLSSKLFQRFLPGYVMRFLEYIVCIEFLTETIFYLLDLL